MSTVKSVAFKRLVIGAKFTCKRSDFPGTYKKVSNRSVIKMNDNGSGQTHTKIPFPTGNTACVVI